MRFEKKLSVFELTVNSYSTKSEIVLSYNRLVVKEFPIYGEVKEDDVRLKPTGYDLPLLISFEEEIVISPNFREILFIPIPPSAEIVIRQGPVYLNFHISPEPLKKGYRAHFFPDDDFYYITTVRPDFTVFSEFFYYIPVRLRSQEKRIVALKSIPMETYQLDWFLHKNFVVSEIVECVEKEDGLTTYFTGKSFFEGSLLVSSGEENAQLLGRKRVLKKDYDMRIWR